MPAGSALETRTTHNEPSRHDNPKVIGAAITVGTAALMILGVQPILLGGLILEGRITEVGLGQVAMAEVFCLAVGSSIGPRLMNQGSMRSRTILVCLLLMLADLATCWSASQTQILISRAGAGLLEGLALGAAVVVLTYTRRPDRLSGLFLGLQTIPQMIAALLFPPILLPRLGVNAGFIVLGAIALAGAAAAALLVRHVETPRDEKHAGVAWNIPLGCLLVAILLQNAGIGAAWSYSERLAAQHGLPPSMIGVSLSASLVWQVVGALGVAWVGWRMPHRATLIWGSLVQSGVVLIMLQAIGPVAFVATTSVFGLLWLALQPFQVNYAIERDPTRVIAVLLTPIALVGFSLGPLIVSAAVSQGDVVRVYIIASVLLAGAGAFYLGASRLGQADTERPNPATDGPELG